MFRLSWIEVAALARSKAALTSSVRSQSVTLNTHARFRPFAFIEEGVAMLSAVLRSEAAVRVSLAIIRAFVRLRRAVLGREWWPGMVPLFTLNI